MRIIRHGDVWVKENQEVKFQCKNCGCKYGEHAYLCQKSMNFRTHREMLSCVCPECGTENEVPYEESNE